jgi:signal transduction histidine kinase
MPRGDKRNPSERSSTDESLRSERRKTDTELAQRSHLLAEVATDVITEARDKADSVLSDARAREDRKHPDEPSGSSAQVTQERAREDALLRHARSGADTAARNESEQRRVALASLLAFERGDTDLRLEVERKRADQILSSREDFMAMVSHDLRSLLGGIALSAELLKEVERHDEPFVKVTQYAERIQRLSARMNRLVGDLMDVASIEAGKLALIRSSYSASLVLRDSHDAFAPAAAAHGIQLSCDGGDADALEIDPERILQVIANLVGNALKFTPRGGRIAVRAERRHHDAVFSVEDTGRGVPADLLHRIFERYFQTNDSDRRGLGLGLFISKSIVEAHGGTIWATSVLGKGSTFYFTVPRG